MIRNLIEKLKSERHLTREEYIRVLTDHDAEDDAFAASLARETAVAWYGHDIYLRGLIELTNICRNNCYYCGIRAGNVKADRYRLDKDTILQCADEGYGLGFRTFVLQGGEDPWYTDEIICDIVRSIKDLYPDCAITLSLGEKEKDQYQAYFDAGADRYLLRHETANEEHYRKLHPESLSLAHRKQCLYDLKEIGYAVGAGFMVGSPYQTVETLADDYLFLEDLQPDMIGIGPFLPHKDTPFKDFPAGSVPETIFHISLLRLLIPSALIPATTALGTADPMGREKGVLAGANVIMPNLSPVRVRGKYLLYDGKICTGDEAAECRSCLQARMQRIGYQCVIARGDRKTEKGGPAGVPFGQAGPCTNS